MPYQTSAAVVHHWYGAHIAVQVDGDHRVGIFARKDLPAGSELFYNYRWVSRDAACASSSATAAQTANNLFAFLILGMKRRRRHVGASISRTSIPTANKVFKLGAALCSRPEAAVLRMSKQLTAGRTLAGRRWCCLSDCALASAQRWPSFCTIEVHRYGCAAAVPAVASHVPGGCSISSPSVSVRSCLILHTCKAQSGIACASYDCCQGETLAPNFKDVLRPNHSLV
jgi:hypothetical protein